MNLVLMAIAISKTHIAFISLSKPGIDDLQLRNGAKTTQGGS
jgi:hypothetical protein